MARINANFNPALARRKTVGRIFYFVFLSAVMVGIVGLLVLLTQIVITGWSLARLGFISSYPSRHPEQAGIRSAVMGTIWAISLTALFTVPIGVGAAIYLEEYAPRNWLTGLIEINIPTLRAFLPSCTDCSDGRSSYSLCRLDGWFWLAL